MLMNRVKRNIAQLYFDVLKEPLNAGNKMQFLVNFFRWKLFHKHSGKRWIIRLENNMKSYVYPFPGHDAGEVNIRTRDVNSHQDLFAAPHGYFVQSILPTQSRA